MNRTCATGLLAVALMWASPSIAQDDLTAEDLAFLQGEESIQTCDEDAPDWCATSCEEEGTYLRGEVMILRRRRMDNRSFANRWSDNALVLHTRAWDTPVEPGGRLTLGRWVTPNSAFEVSAYWVDEFSDRTSYSAPSGTFRQPFYNHDRYAPRPVIGELPTLVELENQTQIHNIEINYRHRRSLGSTPFRIGGLIGPRFFSLEEQFQDYDSRTAVRGANPTDSVYETWVDNNLFGGHIGPTIGLATERMGADLDLIWGGFFNDTTGTNQLRLQDDSVVFFRSANVDLRFSGLIEFRLNGYWSLTHWARLYAGYHAMYVWNMTSAPDVLSFNLLKQSKANNELAFWIHGPTAGIEIRF